MRFLGTSRRFLIILEMSFSIAQGIDHQRSNSSTQGPSPHENHDDLQSVSALMRVGHNMMTILDSFLMNILGHISNTIMVELFSFKDYKSR